MQIFPYGVAVTFMVFTHAPRVRLPVWELLFSCRGWLKHPADGIDRFDFLVFFLLGVGDGMQKKSPEPLFVLRQAKEVSALAFLPGNEYLCSGSQDGRIIIWYMTRRRAIKQWQGHHSTPLCATPAILSIIPLPNFILSHGRDGDIHAWPMAECVDPSPSPPSVAYTLPTGCSTFARCAAMVVGQQMTLQKQGSASLSNVDISACIDRPTNPDGSFISSLTAALQSSSESGIDQMQEEGAEEIVVEEGSILVAVPNEKITEQVGDIAVSPPVSDCILIGLILVD